MSLEVLILPSYMNIVFKLLSTVLFPQNHPFTTQSARMNDLERLRLKLTTKNNVSLSIC